jgi:hypothetical protein
MWPVAKGFTERPRSFIFYDELADLQQLGNGIGLGSHWLDDEPDDYASIFDFSHCDEGILQEEDAASCRIGKDGPPQHVIIKRSITSRGKDLDSAQKLGAVGPYLVIPKRDDTLDSMFKNETDTGMFRAGSVQYPHAHEKGDAARPEVTKSEYQLPTGKMQELSCYIGCDGSKKCGPNNTTWLGSSIERND